MNLRFTLLLIKLHLHSWIREMFMILISQRVRMRAIVPCVCAMMKCIASHLPNQSINVWTSMHKQWIPVWQLTLRPLQTTALAAMTVSGDLLELRSAARCNHRLWIAIHAHPHICILPVRSLRHHPTHYCLVPPLTASKVSAYNSIWFHICTISILLNLPSSGSHLNTTIFRFVKLASPSKTWSIDEQWSFILYEPASPSKTGT